MFLKLLNLFLIKNIKNAKKVMLTNILTKNENESIMV